MADNKLKDTLAEMDEFLRKLGIAPAQIQQIEDKLSNTIGKNKAFQDLKNDADKVTGSARALTSSITPIADLLNNARAAAAKLPPVLADAAVFTTAVVQGLYNTTNAALQAGDAFNKIAAGTKMGFVVGGIDEATKMSKEFRGEAIKISSEFGEGFDQSKKSFQNYAGAILMAQNATYASREAIEGETLGLAKMGITLGEISKTLTVAGEKQNLLTEGFRLAQDSGLAAGRVFEIMATASRKMGLSIEDANRPVLALESLAKTTGLPITELSNRVFGLATQYSRFGMSVESISPILRRFTSVLGEGFKGLAIQDTIGLIEGLAGKVNTTEAAFMAMQSGMARPGAGVAGAMLDFEDAMAEPEKAMKMLSGSLGNISGGKILTMQDAHASEANATQFKLQRDMLSQLTGINNPQQTKTLMALLADQQSGKALTAAENKTLSEAMKSGASKQEESKSLAEKIGKAQTVLLAQIALSLSNKVTRPDIESGLVSGATAQLAEKSVAVKNMLSKHIDEAMTMGEDFFAKKTPESIKNMAAGAKGAVGGFIDQGNARETEIPVQSISAFNAGEEARLYGGRIPEATNPTPNFRQVAPNPSTAESSPAAASKTAQAPGETGAASGGTFIIRGTDEFTRAIAAAMTHIHNKTIHGHG